LACSLIIGVASAFAACGSSTGGAGFSGGSSAGWSGAGAGGMSACPAQCGGTGGAGGAGAIAGSAGAGGHSGGLSCGPSVCPSGQKCCDSSCGSCSIGGICPASQCPGAGGASGGGAGGGSAGTGGAGGGGGTGGSSSAVDCHLKDPTGFPSFDRTCSTLNDCTAVSHQISCCGTRVLTGIKTSELTRFNAAEQACEAQYPACGCAQSPTTTDTGQVATSASEPVECLMGTCTTYVP